VQYLRTTDSRERVLCVVAVLDVPKNNNGEYFYQYRYIPMCIIILCEDFIAKRIPTVASAFLRGCQTRHAAGAAADERVRGYTRTLTRSCPVIRRVIRAFKSPRFPRAPIRPGPYFIHYIYRYIHIAVPSRVKYIMLSK